MNPNMKILVVDDFSTMRRVLRGALKQIGLRNVKEAENGREALLKLKIEKYDLILCDWNMPEMTGLELLQKIRSDEKLKNIPFIMITAEAKKECIIEAAKSGVNSYIVKPFTAETIKEKLQRIFK